MRKLYYACLIEKNSTNGKEISAYILPIPIPTLQLAFTTKEQLYYLGFVNNQ